MSTTFQDLPYAFETHSVETARAILDAGLDANARILLRASERNVPQLENVPHRYLAGS